jgi:molecular chaperone GrpE
MTERERRVEVTESVADSSVPSEEPAEAAVNDDISRIAGERDDYLEALKRLQADFENYKKRILKQQTEHLERAAESLVEKLLPALDTFDLALAHGEGFDQAQAALMAALEKEGLERIDAVGKPFDPNEHDAVAHEPDDSGGAGGGPVVTDVMRTGYRWKGRLVRPAMVKVKG